MSASTARSPNHGARLGALVVFASAMGWLEGVVVVYIRAILGIGQNDALPSAADVLTRMGSHAWMLPTEQGREAATILMLLGVAWLAGDRFRSRFGAFLIAFGVWDIVYYIALYALIRWPSSLTTMDVLFLLPPHPWWSQPVWVPVLIASAMVAVGAWMFRPAEQI